MALSDADSFCPLHQEDWRKWLLENHRKHNSVWLIFYKSNSDQFNLSWSQAVDEAICFGWIDSLKRSIDDYRYKQYFSKRKPNSTWSKINKTKVQDLLDANKMHSTGLDAIEIAKQNGNWTLLDDVEDLIIPHDLKQHFENNPLSHKHYHSLSNSLKKGVLQWVVIAKRNSTRQKRIREVIENGNNNQLPKHFE